MPVTEFAHDSADDSDFIDSDLEVDLGTQAIPTISRTVATSSCQDGAVGMASSQVTSATAATPVPAMPLLQITPGFHFTYFNAPLPSQDELNEGDGLHCAVFDQIPGHPATAMQTCLSTEDPLQEPQNLLWFCIDEELQYLKFFNDWGPLNIAMFYRFVMHIHWLQTEHSETDLVLYTSNDPHHKANAALLMAMYALTKHRASPADAFFPFSHMEFEPYRDAGYGRADFYLTIQDILYGLDKAIKVGLLDLQTFNLEEYECYEQVKNGDFNWITPNFIAFASPNEPDYRSALKAGTSRKPKLRSPLTSGFAKIIEYFKKRNVALVVRLNNPLYEKQDFEDAGIAHEDMYFDDGSNPSTEIIKNFIEKAHKVISNGGVVAVHCKAGLGRTGVLIGAYLTWRWGFTSNEAIGFMRLMRPGCVVGPQQHFMYQNFPEWIRWGAREQALAEAKEEIEEKTKALEARYVAAAASSARAQKRPATPTSSLASAIHSVEAGSAPETPPSKRSHRAPASVAPSVKPIPCVGQPRKSPSPARKRHAQQTAPATTSRIGSLSRSLNEGRHSGGATSGDDSGPGTPLASRTFALRASELTNMQPQGMTVGPVVAAGLVPEILDACSTKDMTIAAPVSAGPRPRPGGHQRSQSEVGPGTLPSVEEANAIANLTPTSARIAAGTLRASPTVKDKYGLRDANTAHEKSPASTSNSQPTLSSTTSTAEVGVESFSSRANLSASSSASAAAQRKISDRPAARSASNNSTHSNQSDRLRASAASSTTAPARATKLVRQSSRSAASGMVRADSATLNNKLRAGSTRTAQDARRELRAAEAAVRAESNPSSRLTAPTVSSAARSRGPAGSSGSAHHVPWSQGRAGLKRPRVDSPELKSDDFFSPPSTGSSSTVLQQHSSFAGGGSGVAREFGSAMGISTRRIDSSQATSSSTGAGRLTGRHVRPRRSSTGDANINVLA